jgi:hypothetical protein
MHNTYPNVNKEEWGGPVHKYLCDKLSKFIHNIFVDVKPETLVCFHLLKQDLTIALRQKNVIELEKCKLPYLKGLVFI